MNVEEKIAVLNAFLNGVITMGHAVAGLFFLRFWKKTRDRLFVMFGVAFWILGLIQTAIVFVGEPGEEHYLYWMRFAAYLLILAAIVDKNFRK
jgi:hypothetical protein